MLVFTFYSKSESEFWQDIAISKAEEVHEIQAKLKKREDELLLHIEEIKKMLQEGLYRIFS